MQYTLKYSTIESCSSRQATVNIKVPTTNLTTIINQVMRFYGWDSTYANRIASEYLKFITIRSANPQTSPSAAIDKFWHMHILNTSHYMNFCNENYYHYIHHNVDDSIDQVARKTRLFNTVMIYLSNFGYDILDDIWNDSDYDEQRRPIIRDAIGETGSTGPAGPTGPWGPCGTYGKTNASGYTGPTDFGYRGPSGPCGTRGKTDASGYTDPTGALRAIGGTGATGPTGALRAIGAIGAIGGTGATGPKIGPIGATGPC